VYAIVQSSSESEKKRVEMAIDSGLVTRHDILTIVHGYLIGVAGTTNTIQVLDLKDYLGT
jgi:pyruvate kinase